MTGAFCKLGLARRAAPHRLWCRSQPWRPGLACAWGPAPLNPRDAAPARAPELWRWLRPQPRGARIPTGSFGWLVDC